MFIEHPIQIQIQLMTFETVTIFNIMYGWKGLKQNDFGFLSERELFSQDMGTDIQLVGWGPEVKSRLLKGNNEKF